jgi:hypothetical protein
MSKAVDLVVDLPAMAPKTFGGATGAERAIQSYFLNERM